VQFSRHSLLLTVLLSASLCAQTVTESFTGSTAPGWVFGGTGYTPNLTSGGIDPVDNGWLRLTDNGANRATYAYNDTSVTSENRTVFTSFDFASYNGTGADGITFFLFDGAVDFSVGAFGGSMGYAPKTTAGGGEVDKEGLAGGYLAVSLDDFGNFSNPTEGREGGIGSNPNSVSVRGPGDGYDGYEFIAATGDANNAALTEQLDFPSSTTRPDQTGANYRRAEILLTATNQLTVWLQFGAGNDVIKVLEADLSGYLRPETLKFGFTSGTGGQNEIHEVRNLTVATLVANLWDNGANGGSSATGDWSVAQNWNPDVPATGDDILFDNTYVSTNQTVNVGTGQTRVVRSISIDAPFSYTLNNGTLSFDDVGLPGFLGIAVTQTNGVSSTGNTINSAIALQADATIRNATTSALSLGGNIALNANTLLVDGSGNINSGGVISGTGDINKSQAGNLTLSGNNTYSGGTAISGGTITAANNNALGTGAVTMTGGTLAGSGAPTIANAVSLQGNAGLSNLTVSGAVSQTGGNRTLTLDGATISGGVTLAENNQARTLTANVVNDSTISGVIANGTGTGDDGVTKTGAAALTLSGNNSFTGALTINEGSVRLGANDRLDDAVDVAIGSSGTLDLNGYSERIDNLTATAGGATLDFGSTSGANTFLFDNYTAPASGVLVVNNWEDGLDNLATTVAAQTSITDGGIYISGYGVADYDGMATIYGASRNLLRPVGESIVEWDGSSSANWNTGDNWTTLAKPTTSQVALFGNLGLGRTSVALNGSNSIRGVIFDEDATSGYTISSSGGGTQRLTLSYTGGVPFIQQKSNSTQTIAVESLRLGGNTVADITGSGNLVISAPIDDNGGGYSLVKDGIGSGKLILSGNNTFGGGMFINTGIVEARNSNAIGTGAATITSGATLELSNNIDISEAITLGGSGVGGNGVIRNLSGANTLSGNLTLSNASRFQSDSGTLTLSGTNALDDSGRNLTFGGAGNITVSKVISTGAGTVTKDGAGVLTLSGTSANTYTGVTTVNDGTLVLDKSASGTTAVAGNLIIGDGTGTDTVRLDESNQITDTASVTLNNGGVFNLNNNSETIAGLNAASTGAQVQLGTGTLTVNNSTANTFAGTLTGAGTLTKTGVGRLTLSTASGSFTGTTNVNGGIVALQSATALGSSAVSVQSGGNVELQGGLTYANAFTLRGDGTGANDGAVENFSGNNTMSGNISLATAARIGSSGGTLTLSNAGTFTGTNQNVTFSGAGNTVVNRNINTGTGTLTKEGTGNLTLSTANSYTGATTISAGKITAGVAGIFSDTTALTVANTAVYDMAGFSETVGSLQGAGSVNFGGATLTLAAGASSFGGDFGFSNGTIVINAGQSLTLTAAMDAANINIILNGGTLFLGNGLNHTFGNLTVNTATTSVIDFGTSGATVAEFDNVFVNGTGQLNVNNWTDAVDYFISNNTTGAQGTAPNTKIVFAGGFTGADTRWLPYGGGGQLTPVPEPSTYGATLLGASVGFLLLRRRRRA
jgi:fibronectin-binding autotransporter adhesin